MSMSLDPTEARALLDALGGDAFPAELEELMQKVADLAVAKAFKGVTNDEMWDDKTVGTYLGLSAWTVRYKKSLERGFPKCIQEGKRRMWRAADIRKYVDRKVT